MNQSTLQRIRPLVKPLRRVLLHLLLILVMGLKVGLPEAAPAYAQAATATSVGQSTAARTASGVVQPTLTQAASGINPCDIVPIPFGVVCDQIYPAPELLYLSQGGLYAATAAQTASLRNLENKAVQDILALHSLPASDDAAVRTWGRDDVLAQLYSVLVEAINTTATSRTPDQQNAVDWITTVAKRRNVAAAQNAAREYVKWAGLNRGNFDAFLRTNPTKAQIEAYLSGPVVNYDLPTVDATEGWCAYRSPAPYSSEYTGYNHPICSSPIIGVFLPPTPTYDQFVKWGEAKASYPLLSSGGFLSRAQSLGIALGLALPLAAIAGGYIVTLAPAVGTAIASAAFDGVSISTLSAVGTFTIVTGVALVATLLVALTAAIILGINVTDAANLPGKLATLVDTANSTAIDASTLTNSSTDSAYNLLSLFVAVTTPMPSLDSCDNSLSLPPGMYPLTNVGTDTTTLTDSTPCLNPTVIPAATATDPQFIVRPNAGGPETLSPTISMKDATSGTVTTARLSGTWFITEANGSTAQTLRLAYTDWSGTKQNAWLIGNPTDGYAFLTFAPSSDASTTLDPATCVANGSCGAGERIKYIGPDGQLYSATVRPYQPPTGTPTVTSAVEGSPVSLNANAFAPGGAVQPVTYLWEFKSSFCNALSCQTVATAVSDRVTYTWQTGGTYQVDLTATDRLGVQATTRLQVPVSSVAPTLTFAPDCATNPNVPCNTWSGNEGSGIALRGTIAYAGSLDHFRVTVNWGDGSQDAVNLETNGSTFPGSSPLTFTPVAGQLALTMLAAHSYASAGVYNGSITVTNVVGVGGDGGTVSRPFSMTVIGNQTISFPSISGHSYGDVFTISATGGGSGQPVTFSTNTSCALSNVSGGSGTGSATVTVISAGFCDITASQAGSAAYNPAPDVRQRVFTLLAPLTATASGPTIVYGATVPAITPSYSGFKLSDTASVLITPATCAVAPNSGAPGSYATTCAGAVAANYSISYVPGTLTINKAPLTITANDKAMTYGGPLLSFDAKITGLVSSDTTSVVSGLSCAAKDAASQPVSSSTPAGTYAITCSGGSAANYSISYVPGTLTINKANTTTVLSASPSASVYGQPVTFTASVSVNSPGSGQLSGTVVFMDGGSAIAGCTAQPVNVTNGIATCTTAALSVAVHSITATYSGAANFTGNSDAPTSARYTVASVVATRHAPTLNSGSRIEGALWLLSGEDTTLNGGTVAGDLLVPGNPTVVRNSGTIGSTVSGSGSATPSGYRLTLNSGANVTRLLTRTDPITLPSVPTPPTPSGTRDVQINAPGQSLGDPATIRNLTLNSNAGAVTLPVGTYGRLTANSGTSYVLGVAGANTPSVYNLQGLTLNGGRLTVVGPVVINLATGFTLNSSAVVGSQSDWLVVNVATGLIQFNSGSAFFGTLRAPASAVTLNSSTRLEGMLLADRVILNGGTVRATP